MAERLARFGVAAITLAVVGCAGASVPSPTHGPIASASPTSMPTASATPTASPSPTSDPDSDSAVVRIEQTGGMMPPWETARWYPAAVLYGDGRLITQGPTDMMYPGPALPNLVVTHYTEAGVEQVLEWAAEAGLVGEDRDLGQQTFDGGSLVFTVVRPDGTHHTRVWDVAGTDAETAAALQFRDVLADLPAYLPDDIASDPTPFPYDRLRIIAFPQTPADLPDPNLANEADWPLDPIESLGTSYGEPAEYRCALIEGTDLETLRPMLEQANELTLWRSEDITYRLYAHPLLPDDEPCPGF